MGHAILGHTILGQAILRAAMGQPTLGHTVLRHSVLAQAVLRAILGQAVLRATVRQAVLRQAVLRYDVQRRHPIRPAAAILLRHARLAQPGASRAGLAIAVDRTVSAESVLPVRGLGRAGAGLTSALIRYLILGRKHWRLVIAAPLTGRGGQALIARRGSTEPVSVLRGQSGLRIPAGGSELHRGEPIEIGGHR